MSGFTVLNLTLIQLGVVAAAVAVVAVVVASRDPTLWWSLTLSLI